MPYAALDEAYHHHDSGAMADSDRIRQDLLQVRSTPASGFIGYPSFTFCKVSPELAVRYGVSCDSKYHRLL